MPRLMMTALMLGSLVLMPACGGEDNADSGSDTDRTDMSDKGGKDNKDTAGNTSTNTSPREKTVQALFEKMNQFPEILSGVNDDASAQAANAEIKTLAESIKPIIEKWNGFGDMSNEEAASMESKFKPQIIAFEEKMKEQFARIAGENPLLMAKLQEGMDAIKDAMGDFDIDG